jgi:hypothetical protein
MKTNRKQEVKRARYPWGDIYKGTRAALIAEGIARKAWFPKKETPGRFPGTVKRSFKTMNDKGNEVKMMQYAPAFDRWEIWIALSEVERAQRAQEKPSAVSAMLAVGTRCKLWLPDHKADGAEAVIVQPFRLSLVQGEGPQYGYVARCPYGEVAGDFFIPAGKLIALDAKKNYSHLVLVVDNGRLQ